MKRCLFSIVSVCSLVAFGAGERVGFKVESNRPSAHYLCGEEAVLTVTATNGLGEAVKSGKVNWTLDNFTSEHTDAGVVAKGVWDFSVENPRVFRATLAKPDFLRLLIKGEIVRDLSAWTPRQFWWGVAFEPEKILPGGPNPSDFDSFWSNAVAKLEREVPLDPRVTRVAERSTKEYDYYRISFATVGGKRVHGFMSVPTDKTKAPYPVIFEVSSAGEGLWTMRMDKGLPDRIRVYFTAHNFEPPETVEELRKIHHRMGSEMRAKYGVGYQSYGLAWSREDYYFYDKILGINRAVNWVWSRDDVDRRHFGYVGGSQGGGFGLYLTGLNKHFTSAVLHVPALCDTLGYQGGHASGWPHLIEQTPADKKAAAAKNAPYFDGANFARRVTCPIRMSVGFVDTACNPASVYAAFNVCPSKDKKICDGIGLGHFGQTAVLDRVNDLWQRSLQSRSVGAGCTSAAEGLRLVPLAYSPVRLRAEPLEPRPQARKVASETEVSDVRMANFQDPVGVIMSEMLRWIMGSSDKFLKREPIGAESLGRWISLGGMAMPSISVSKVVWTPHMYAGESITGTEN